MLLGWGAQEALRVRAGRLARSSLNVGASGLVRSKESIPAIRLVRVVLLSTISVLYRVCQTNNSTLDCSVILRSECSPVVCARIEPVPGSLERCERWNNSIERSNQDKQRCGRFLPLPSAGRRSKSGYLVDSRKSLMSLSWESRRWCHRGQADHCLECRVTRPDTSHSTVSTYLPPPLLLLWPTLVPAHPRRHHGIYAP